MIGECSAVIETDPHDSAAHAFSKDLRNKALRAGRHDRADFFAFALASSESRGMFPLSCLSLLL